MTAAQVLDAAREAGLTVSFDGSKLSVKGPSFPRANFLPILTKLAPEILVILAAARADAANPCRYDGKVCFRCGYIHGHLSADPCDQCGTETWVVSITGKNKERLCSKCLG